MFSVMYASTGAVTAPARMMTPETPISSKRVAAGKIPSAMTKIRRKLILSERSGRERVYQTEPFPLPSTRIPPQIASACRTGTVGSHSFPRKTLTNGSATRTIPTATGNARNTLNRSVRKYPFRSFWELFCTCERLGNVTLPMTFVSSVAGAFENR